MEPAMLKDIAMAIAFWFWVGWPAIAIGLIWFSALNSIGRNPSAANEIRANMILAIAFAEALAIFAFVIAIMIKFVK